MPVDNSEQIADWNGIAGQQWALLQRDLDNMIKPFGAAALATAALQQGQRIIDIGCGCGDTSIALAQLVGETGAVLGVDVSLPMLEVARSRAASARLAHLDFRDADASEAQLPSGNDLLFSRFGVMFFNQPLAAFGHMRTSLRPGGRCVFVCWRTPRDNPWMMKPLAAARQILDITPAPSDPFLPGPFAFADEQRLRAMLSEAGFSNIDVQRFDAAVVLGPTPRAAAEGSVRIGPVPRLVREVGAAHLPVILDAIERSLAPLAAADGSVSLNGSTWIVSASNPV
jgi:ubiquinone/menaquinone biosynthesis C-methylase UbiE